MDRPDKRRFGFNAYGWLSLRMDLKNITAIVPVKNEERNIIAFLKSLPPAVRLIVIDSGTDRTRSLIRITRSNHTEVIVRDCNIPEARQLGAEAATTRWLLYTDADIRFADDYFEHLRNWLPDSRTGAVMGAKLSLDKYRLYYRLYAWSMGLGARVRLPLGSGSNMLIRKEALKDAGGFDPRLTVNEDTYIFWQIQKAGWRVRYEKNLKVYETDHRRLERGVWRKYRHSVSRLFRLYTGWGKERVFKDDQGYWTQ